MKRALLMSVLALAMLAGGGGCHVITRNPCSTCEDKVCAEGCGGLLKNIFCCRRRRAAYGPETPTYGYPYYTTRGPRDFLMDNPPSIGR